MTPEEEAEFIASGPVMERKVESFRWAVQASVSSRRLLEEVDAWSASQSKAVQIAYAYSGSFVRTEPMMAAGLATMGLTEKQIDARSSRQLRRFETCGGEAHWPCLGFRMAVRLSACG